MTRRAPLKAVTAGTVVVILAAAVLALDQYTKHLALTRLPYGKPVHVWGDVLVFILTKNAGAAFSLGTGVTWVFTVILTAVAIAILVITGMRVRGRRWAVVFGLLLGGVLGNLSDRLLREPGFGTGHVVDFINMPWMMPAIMNVADIFITTMMVCVALLVLRGIRFDGTREQPADDTTADAA